MKNSRETLRVAAVLLIALGLAACDGKDKSQPAASAPATAAGEATAPREDVAELQVETAPMEQQAAVPNEPVLAQSSPDMMPRQLIAPSLPVTLTIQVFELRVEGGATRLVEHSRVNVQADASLGCGQPLLLGTPIPASASHAVDSTEPHWAVLDVEIGGARCRSTTAREAGPGVHSVSGFDMEPISTAAPQAAAP